MASHNTKLNDRILWYDGDSSFTPKQLEQYLLTGKAVNDHVFVTDIDSEVKLFNKYNEESLEVKDSLNPFSKDWVLPQKYKDMNLSHFIFSKLLEKTEDIDFSEDDINKRILRVEEELQLYSKYNVTEMLRSLIYLVDTFKINNVVWGVGRGSSCSSYLLYLIELHDVDSVEYDLDITEFLRG